MDNEVKVTAEMEVLSNFVGDYSLFNGRIRHSIIIAGEEADRIIRKAGYTPGDSVRLRLTLEPIPPEKPIWERYG